MLRALNTGVTGIRQYQTNLDTIGNNLANVNTVGFKAGRVEFADTLNQTLRAGTPDSATRSGTSSVQVGNGVDIASVRNLFTQGAVNQTGVTTDLAISGEGFFIVKNIATNELFATRAGDFRVDSNGFLVTDQGFRVQGFQDPPTAADGLYTDADAQGHIKFDKGTAPAAAAADAGISNIALDGSGKINILLSDGTQYVRGQILLQRFSNPNALLKQGNNLYTGLTTAGPLGAGITAAQPFDATPTKNAPNSSGLGRIESGALELSNVDIAREFSNMITTQRAFQANARVVTASDTILQEIVQLTR
ncbi:MAG: flagellar hook-basal body complex protein [Verrucomicrobia bacterium]|nr:flagellar hook-basal body complex protein [Verrucomicrobiota bacterium]